MLPNIGAARSTINPLRSKGTGMPPETTTLERAFELARSGSYATLSAIRVQLKKERFVLVQEHLEGASIRKQLIALIQAANR